MGSSMLVFHGTFWFISAAGPTVRELEKEIVRLYNDIRGIDDDVSKRVVVSYNLFNRHYIGHGCSCFNTGTNSIPSYVP